MQKIVYIGVDKLRPHPQNPRRDLGDLTELAESIRANGVLQNLTVVPAEDDTYRVIIGHRRHAAAKLAELTEVPCVITDMTPQKQFQTMMIENVNRSDLTTYEQAEGFQMMLDMGDTVESVAQQTGFSETTIRRRVKLLDLDKKKFQQAEERGGTMQDYLKLQTITDPKIRNKVLDTVGTTDFATTLKNALTDEETRKYMDGILDALKEADWCREVKQSEVGSKSPYQYVKCYSKWNKNPVTRPEDADTATYVYYIASGRKEAYLYKEKAAAEEKVDPLEEKRKRIVDELSQISQELSSISQNHREIREAYIQNYASFNSSEMDIAALAVKAMLYAADHNTDIDPDHLGAMLGVPVDGDDLDPTAFNRELFNRTQRVLLCVAYATLEGDGQKYNGTVYDHRIKCYKPSHHECLALDLIYAGLKTLEYEMSEEEKQMLTGTHPLYQRAQFLVDGYLKEKEEANEQQEEES